MIDELREEAIIQKVGGRFKLSTLIQKRLIALNHGAKPLVILPRASNLEIVIQEIMQDKICLSMKNELKTIEDDSPVDIPREVDMSSL
ncbi:MAG: DNA-directed RNA polymerase subunit omega [Planctomycetia bacterium]|nr:DNA-directed RNA polymerase subunit omega [Planctomycetia bacterium]